MVRWWCAVIVVWWFGTFGTVATIVTFGTFVKFGTCRGVVMMCSSMVLYWCGVVLVCGGMV